MAEKSFQDKMLPVMVVALIGAAFALGVMWGKVQVYEKGIPGGNALGAVEQGQQPVESPVLDDDQWNSILSNQAYAFGDEGAKVTVVEFTDYQCPFCKRYIDDTFGKIKENYVDTGKVRYIMHDLPLSFHPFAKPAAIAARCAGEQGKYAEMHEKIFASQDEWSTGDAEAAFSTYASELGLNGGTFASCLSSEKIDQAVSDDLSLASSVGASGTPTFFVNGKRLVGAQPYEAFESAIEEALK